MVRADIEVRYISVLGYAAVGTGLSSSTGHREILTTTLYGLMQIESRLVPTRFLAMKAVRHKLNTMLYR